MPLTKLMRDVPIAMIRTKLQGGDDHDHAGTVMVLRMTLCVSKCVVYAHLQVLLFVYISSHDGAAGLISQCCCSVTSRTVGTVGLLSRFSVLQFPAHCCTCPTVIPSSFKFCSHPVLRPSCIERSLRVDFCQIYCTYPTRFSRDLPSIPCWVFLEMHSTSTQDLSSSQSLWPCFH